MKLICYIVLIFSFLDSSYNFYKYYKRCAIKRISILILKTIKYDESIKKHLTYFDAALFYLALFVFSVCVIIW